MIECIHLCMRCLHDLNHTLLRNVMLRCPGGPAPEPAAWMAQPLRMTSYRPGRPRDALLPLCLVHTPWLCPIRSGATTQWRAASAACGAHGRHSRGGGRGSEMSEIIIGGLNIQSFKPKLLEVSHDLDRYRLDVLSAGA